MNKNKKYVPKGVDTIEEIYKGYVINEDVESEKNKFEFLIEKMMKNIKWYK